VNRRSLILVLFLCSLASLPPCAAGGAPKAEPPSFVPDPLAEGAPELHGATWSERGETYQIELQEIDEAERLAFIKHRTGLSTDPFASRRGEPARFATYVLAIQNLGTSSLAFNPKSCWLSTNKKKDLQTPFGLYDLSFSYRMTDREMPEAYRKAGRALFEDPLLVGAGESVSGLLIYEKPGPKVRWLRVDVQLTLPDGHVVSFTAPYERFKEDKKKKAKTEGETAP